eukprot:9725482-Ditylum_brightwellii.AAC.1
MEKFMGAPVIHGAQIHRTFGCPVYSLDHRLQTDNGSVPKWNPRARLGIYLGPSSRHVRNVSLVLSLETSPVSPQFHVVHDDFCKTIRASPENPTVMSK